MLFNTFYVELKFVNILKLKVISLIISMESHLFAVWFCVHFTSDENVAQNKFNKQHVLKVLLTIISCKLGMLVRHCRTVWLCTPKISTTLHNDFIWRIIANNELNQFITMYLLHLKQKRTVDICFVVARQ